MPHRKIDLPRFMRKQLDRYGLEIIHDGRAYRVLDAENFARLGSCRRKDDLSVTIMQARNKKHARNR